MVPSGAAACTVRSAAVLPDPRLVLPEMSTICTSATASTYPARTASPPFKTMDTERARYRAPALSPRPPGPNTDRAGYFVLDADEPAGEGPGEGPGEGQ